MKYSARNTSPSFDWSTCLCASGLNNAPVKLVHPIIVSGGFRSDIAGPSAKGLQIEANILAIVEPRQLASGILRKPSLARVIDPDFLKQIVVALC